MPIGKRHALKIVTSLLKVLAILGKYWIKYYPSIAVMEFHEIFVKMKLHNSEIIYCFVHNFMKPEFKNSLYWIEINSNEIFYFSAIAKLNSTNLERIGAWTQMTRTLHSICSSIRCILIPFRPLCML